MKIDLYHLYRRLNATNLAYPIALDILKAWAESVGWQARVSISRESRVNLSSDAKVVGFSVYTQTAPAAYRLAEKLRRREKIVILGGPHFRGPDTYQEASPYCDVLVSSICEHQWKALLKSINKGSIRPNRREALLIVDRRKSFRYPDNFFGTSQSHRWYQFPSVPTSLGCPYNCDFCSPYMQGDYVLREIGTIASEVARIEGKTIWVPDATFGLNKAFTVELMKAIAPLGKKIILETSLARLQDREVVRALAHGGVKWIIVGVETLTSKLAKHGATGLNDGLGDIIHRAHDYGMIVHGNFICGLDSDGPEVFDDIYDCYVKAKLDLVMVSILTPFPNTALYHRLKMEGRIIDNNWGHYDKYHVVFRPMRMKVDQFINGYIQLCQSLFSSRRVFRESLDLLKTRGVVIESTAAVGYKFGYMLDGVRRRRMLRHGQEQLAQDYRGDTESYNLPDSTPNPL